MTKINARKAPAGPELDAAVAMTMGWRPPFYGKGAWKKRNGEHVYLPPSFSTDISAAWKLLTEGTTSCNIEKYHNLKTDKPWWEVRLHKESWGWGVGETAPLAICRSFLIASEVEEIEVNSD